MYLYCISSGDLCKFGFSGEPLKRLRALQTGSGSQLHLVHSVLVEEDHLIREYERVLHREIGLHRRVRGEWFDIDEDTARDLLTWFEIHYL